MQNDVKERALRWLDPVFDAETRTKVEALLKEDGSELTECFYRNLEFGTGGLRGLMGVGTNRMNVYTVGMATQGLCNYLKRCFASLPVIKVAIAYDSRNNSALFARTAAGIFSANGMIAYLFDELRPTPELSFAIRHLGCQSGLVITASHNPKEYNGYKAYWNDGGQVIAPHDNNIIAEVEAIRSPHEVHFDGPAQHIISIGSEIDELYTNAIATLSLSPEVIARQKDLKIVYTPIHGTGVTLVPMMLKKLGFSNLIHVPAQDVSDGNFPTVVSPNPEEAAALSMAIEQARATDADIVMATDPDADRVGLAVKESSGEWILLNGNQAASLLIDYLVSRRHDTGRLTGNEYLVKTIVTTELVAEIGKAHGVKCYDVLTGFKWIADMIARNEGKGTFIGGGEESYGYLCGDFVRDKDAVMSCALFAEIAAYAKDQGKTLYDLLLDIYTRYGLYLEKGISVVKKGKSGAEEIQAMMEGYRKNPLTQINGSEVVKRIDYMSLEAYDTNTGQTSKVDLPESDVIQYFTADGSKITIRPSGTEPKIKFYIAVQEPLASSADFRPVQARLEDRIEAIAGPLHCVEALSCGLL